VITEAMKGEGLPMKEWILSILVTLGMVTALRLGLEAIVGLCTLVERCRGWCETHQSNEG
jgi:hypothetical protein